MCEFLVNIRISRKSVIFSEYKDFETVLVNIRGFGTVLVNIRVSRQFVIIFSIFKLSSI